MTATAVLAPPVYRAPLEVIAGASKAVLPPRRIGLADHADKYRMVSTGGHAGSYSFELTPYMRAPHDAVDSALYRAVAIVGPGQSGKTNLAENWFLKMVDADPGNTLWYLANEKQVQSYVKRVIDEMVRSHTKLYGRLGRGPTDNSLAFKRFERMWVEFLEATKANLINKYAGRIIADEIDAWDKRLGDPYALLRIRMQTFTRAMALFLSHPDRTESLDPEEWVSGIMRLYRDSTRCTWWWPCLRCGDYSSPTPGQPHYMRVVYNERLENIDDIAKSARLHCSHCDARLEDRDRREMNANGVWAGMGQRVQGDGTVTGPLRETEIAGFWIMGVMSPFTDGGLAGMVRARVSAERERDVSGDGTTFKEVMSKSWSIPTKKAANDSHAPLDIKALKALAQMTELGVVPDGVRYLVAAVDVQKNRFEVLVEGRGVNPREVWTIARFAISLSNRENENGDRLPLDPAIFDEDWHVLTDELVMLRYPLADDSGREMEIQLVTCDSGGAKGVTERAYAYWRHLRKEGLSNRFCLVRGDGRRDQPLLRMTYPDSQRRDRKARARGEVPVCMINVNMAKDTLSGDLRTETPGPRFHHHPVTLSKTFWTELCSEERDEKTGAWSRRVANAANETFALKVYGRAAARLCGGENIDWNKPPDWADEWENNVFVHDPSPDDGMASADGGKHERRSIGELMADALQ